jgi:hypothetical protein
MDERIRFIKHKEHSILLIDASNCGKRDMLLLLPEVQATVGEQPRDSVLALADFTGAEVDKEVATRIKEVLVFDRPYVKRVAWVGTQSLPSIFYENFKTFSRRDLPIFETRAEAMDWLVADSDDTRSRTS